MKKIEERMRVIEEMKNDFTSFLETNNTQQLNQEMIEKIEEVKTTLF